MSVAIPSRQQSPRFAIEVLVLILVALALTLTIRGLIAGNFFTSLTGPLTPLIEFERLRLIYSFLPRVAVSILAGMSLGFSGAIFQHVLRNPLAEPTTLGTSAGAALAIVAASLFAPGLLEHGQIWIALTGAAASTALVIFLASGSSISPLTLVMSGLVISFLCGNIGGILVLFHTQYLNGFFIWSAGSLVQTDWRAVLTLVPCMTVTMGGTALFLRPLNALTLEDEGARSLGLPVSTMRLVTLGLSVALAAFVVSAVGVIGFVGLTAPAVARILGAHRMHDRLIWATLLGGTMLWLTDQAVQLIQTFMPTVTTGMTTALIAAPILLWLLPRSRTVTPPKTEWRPIAPLRRPSPATRLIIAGLLVALTVAALDFGQGPQGWHFSNWTELQQLLPWRWPRVLASIAAGAMLASAGTLMQRLTGNSMASPEVLGISAGALLGVIVLFYVIGFPGKPMLIGAASGGSLVALVAMLTLGRSVSFSPDRLLLVGVAIGGLSGALVSFLTATGDPRLSILLSWMAGTTYATTGIDAISCAVLCVALLAIAPIFHRWLAILPLGDETSRGIGIGVGRSRFAILLCIAGLTSIPTIIVGPLTFIGLMAPHMARMLGLRRPIPQLWGSALLGALIMLTADWLGRNLLFPDQTPAGLLATLIGAPYFLWQMRRTAA